jgi:phage FluMu gp28-like protein
MPAAAPPPARRPDRDGREALIRFLPYQREAFADRHHGVAIWFWGRQCRKSSTGAAWAVDRLLTQVPKHGRWLVTVLSNSKDNGAEFNLKVGEICELLGQAYEAADLSPDGLYEHMVYETRVRVGGGVGRIKVLAANPRTARGFSGDLILDEFAFHEDSQRIWEAAEPILAAHPEYLCRIMSTGNGRQNMFYRMVTSGRYPVSNIRRSDAWGQGLPVYHPVTREPITPDQARELALDKRAYDQNYENVLSDESMALLTYELIGAAEDPDVGEICEQDWSAAALARLHAARGDLYAGVDVGRSRDLTVLSVFERLGGQWLCRALLRCAGMRLPEQQRRLRAVCEAPRFHRAAIDMTGLGLGLVEYAQEQFGRGRILGVNFATSVPLTRRLAASGRAADRVRVTEAMATELLAAYEDRRIKHPVDELLREDLRKPERLTTPGGRVSIAAAADASGHADHFWSFALALEAGHLTAEGAIRDAGGITLQTPHYRPRWYWR